MGCWASTRGDICSFWTLKWMSVLWLLIASGLTAELLQDMIFQLLRILNADDMSLEHPVKWWTRG